MLVLRNGQNQTNKGRHRRMYELTGVPGWIRYGSSPGFSGGKGGLGPCAEYIQKTGQMDEFIKSFNEQNPGAYIWQNAYQKMEEENPNYRKDAIIDRIKTLEDELKNLKKQLKEYR